MRFNSAEDVQARYLAAMGSELGTFYTALCNELIWLYAKWLEYRKLYAQSPERIDLLNEAASSFFGMIQAVLWDDILLHLARLTDKRGSGDRTNLTIQRLPDLVTDTQLQARLQLLVTAALETCAFLENWRNKRLAHADLKLALDAGAELLPPISRQQLGEALAAVAAVVNAVQSHYFDSTIAFEHFASHSDAEALIYQLALAARTEA